MVVAAAALLLMAGGAAAGARSPAPSAAAPPRLDLDAWLAEHPTLAAALIWQDTDGRAKAFAQWPAPWKEDLRGVFREIAAGRSPRLSDAPPFLSPAGAPAPLIADQVRYKRDVAWRIYAAYVAQSLAMEIGHRLPWSIAEYSREELAPLLDGRSMFAWDEASGGYRIPYDTGAVTAGDPVRLFSFLRRRDIVGPTPHETIIRLLDWTRANVIHFSGDWDVANVTDIWQYPGWPPVERMITGTRRSSQPGSPLRSFTGGCYGTVGFLRTVLRTANIPVALLAPCPGHASPYFVHEGLYLSHGDDPYNAFLQGEGAPPTAQLLIDRSKWKAWFVRADEGYSLTICKNVGRRVRELAIEYLPAELLQLYCADVAAGKGHAAGQVYAELEFNYGVGELEAAGLWKRLADKVAHLGGCAKVPRI